MPDSGRALFARSKGAGGLVTSVAPIRQRLQRFLAGSDLAVGYAGVVSVLVLVLAVLPQRAVDRIVLDSSTNLVNLRQHPPLVLVVSAFPGLSLVFAAGLVLGRSFTDLGHACAWLIGLGLAVLVVRAQRVPLTPVR